MPNSWINLSPRARSLLREGGIALGAATVVAVSPFVPPWPWLKEGVFVLLAVGIFLYRRSGRADAGGETGEASSVAGWPPPLVLFCLLGIALLFQPTLWWMYRQWTASVWMNTHGIFIPPLVLYLGWIVWQRDRTSDPQSSPWGFAFLVPALLLFVLDLSLRTRFVSSIAFVLCLPGLSLLFLGTRRTSEMRLPLIIAAFMVPLPFLVTSVLFLRELTTEGVVAVLRMGGVAVYSTGTLIQLTWGPFRVSEACSGLATFYSAIAIAVVFAGLSDSPARRVALLTAAIPLAIASNIVRVLLLVFLCKIFGNELLETPVHEGSGAATFVVVFFVLHRIASPRQIRGALA